MAKLRVGYPDTMDPDLLSLFPKEAELICIPAVPTEPIEIEFWIPPAFATAPKIWPWLKGVRVAQSLLAGVDWLRAIVSSDVTLCSAAGVHDIPTAEWAVTAILSVLRYIPLYDQLRVAQDWRGRTQASEHYRAITKDTRPYNPPVLQEELAGKRVLIVGYGAIGKAIEKRLLAFEAEVVRIARTARPAQHIYAVTALDELLPQADIVVLILPFTPESAGLIGAEQLALMKQGALLVNAARGGVVQTAALVDALNSGRIRAAVDVTDPEPLPEDHPLWKCPNLMITPHVAASTPEFGRRTAQLAADQVRRYIAGEKLLNIITGTY